MTIADRFRQVLLRESSLPMREIRAATFEQLALRMAAEVGEDRLRELEYWHIVEPFTGPVAA